MQGQGQVGTHIRPGLFRQSRRSCGFTSRASSPTLSHIFPPTLKSCKILALHVLANVRSRPILNKILPWTIAYHGQGLDHATISWPKPLWRHASASWELHGAATVDNLHVFSNSSILVNNFPFDMRNSCQCQLERWLLIYELIAQSQNDEFCSS
ncbi:hypothetical protein VNO77_26726 [Canavalia gladiata]|uniref:Uncharacterized protein n=1 Tax=Canavalia gladiata TaxID=3824 RepID=A0AAN9KUK8_CANGL